MARAAQVALARRRPGDSPGTAPSDAKHTPSPSGTSASGGRVWRDTGTTTTASAVKFPRRTTPEATVTDFCGFTTEDRGPVARAGRSASKQGACDAGQGLAT